MVKDVSTPSANFHQLSFLCLSVYIIVNYSGSSEGATEAIEAASSFVEVVKDGLRELKIIRLIGKFTIPDISIRNG